MTIQEKIILEKDGNVHLFKEGVFWVAYEKSAYIVCLLKKYKPTKKFIKAVGQEVVSAGFPESALENIVGANLCVRPDLCVRPNENNKNHVILDISLPCFQDLPTLGENFNENFLEWKNNLETNKIKNINFEPEMPIVEKIKQFDLHNATPLECMNFLATIKSKI